MPLHFYQRWFHWSNAYFACCINYVRNRNVVRNKASPNDPWTGLGLLTKHFAGKDPRSDDIFAKDSLACPNFRSKVSLENHRGFRIYDQKFEMPRTFTSWLNSSLMFKGQMTPNKYERMDQRGQNIFKTLSIIGPLPRRMSCRFDCLFQVVPWTLRGAKVRNFSLCRERLPTESSLSCL